MDLNEFHKQFADAPLCFQVELRNYLLYPIERKACFIEGYISALEAVHLFKTADAVSYWLAVIDSAKGNYALANKLIVEMDNPPAGEAEQQ
jgi:hypothetical protein